VNPTHDGLVDTNVFLHALTSDRHSSECRQFLAAVERGAVRARIEPIVLHELSYALKHYVKQMSRDDVAQYLLMVIGWKGIQGEKDVLVDAVERWRRTPHLAFVDAYLAALALQRSCPVYTKNARELEGQGIGVPQPLPDGSRATRGSARGSAPAREPT
jgi:predicted nucleic acid-binding protein